MPGEKSKKSFRASTNLLLGIPPNIAAGPLGFRAALDINPKGERNRPAHEMSEDRPDTTAIIGDGNPEPSRIVFRERESGTQGVPTPGTSPAAAIRDIGQVDRLTSKCD